MMNIGFVNALLTPCSRTAQGCCGIPRTTKLSCLPRQNGHGLRYHLLSKAPAMKADPYATSSMNETPDSSAIEGDIMSKWNSTLGAGFDILRSRKDAEDRSIFYSDIQLEDISSDELHHLAGRLVKAVLFMVDRKFLFLKREKKTNVLVMNNAGYHSFHGFQARKDELIVLGRLDTSTILYGAEFSKSTASVISNLAQKQYGHNLVWSDARTHAPFLDGPDAAIVAKCNGYLSFHSLNPYNSRSGNRMTSSSDGLFRFDTSQNQSSASTLDQNRVYPRIDPAILVLVLSSTRNFLLLGSSSKWTKGRFSCLAGFCTIAETVEQAVVREVKEESDIDVCLSSVQYQLSQPWPFPQSLMLGFTATAKSSSIDLCGDSESLNKVRNIASNVGLSEHEFGRYWVEYVNPGASPRHDGVELVDARWFHQAWIFHFLATNGIISSPYRTTYPPGTEHEGFSIPGNYAAANTLIVQHISRVSERYPLPLADIDAGKFKYVLLKHIASGQLVVRGYLDCKYHIDCLHKAEHEATQAGVSAKFDVLGGGRIEHYLDQKVIHVYGYSTAFGQAPHDLTANILRAWYPFYNKEDIVASYDGY